MRSDRLRRGKPGSGTAGFRFSDESVRILGYRIRIVPGQAGIPGGKQPGFTESTVECPPARRADENIDAMPTVVRSGPYRLFFYSADRNEPPHVHVTRDSCVAKYWLNPLRHEWSVGFRPVEIRRIQAIIAENRELILEAWDEYFSQ